MGWFDDLREWFSDNFLDRDARDDAMADHDYSDYDDLDEERDNF